jgi:hypothetical protein
VFARCSPPCNAIVSGRVQPVKAGLQLAGRDSFVAIQYSGRIVRSNQKAVPTYDDVGCAIAMMGYSLAEIWRAIRRGPSLHSLTLAYSERGTSPPSKVARFRDAPHGRFSRGAASWPRLPCSYRSRSAVCGSQFNHFVCGNRLVRLAKCRYGMT